MLNYIYKNDIVEGVVLKVSKEEIEQSDEYEVSDYKRIKVILSSEISAWAYVNAKDCSMIPIRHLFFILYWKENSSYYDKNDSPSE